MLVMLVFAILLIFIAFMYGYSCGANESSAFSLGDGYDDGFEAAKEIYSQKN